MPRLCLCRVNWLRQGWTVRRKAESGLFFAALTVERIMLGKVVKTAHGKGQGIVGYVFKPDEAQSLAGGDGRKRRHAKRNGQFNRAGRYAFKAAAVTPGKIADHRVAFFGGEGFQQGALHVLYITGICGVHGRSHKGVPVVGCGFCKIRIAPEYVGFHVAAALESADCDGDTVNPVEGSALFGRDDIRLHASSGRVGSAVTFT